MTNSLAILNQAGKVVTFVRSDVSPTWVPPANCTAVPVDQLPEGWEMSQEVSVPAQVSSRQLRLWLLQNGTSMQTVETAINNIEDAFIRETINIEWQYASYIERDNAWLALMASNLGFDSDRLDTAFYEASLL